ncbi:MAG: class I SAM-dependent methyltransferase [Thermodesulfobacteriota bacterium]
MEKSEYKTMYEVEDSYWWYVGLRELIFSYLKRQYPCGGNLKILDTGCSTGALLKMLTTFGQTQGIDISEYALTYCKKRGLDQILQGSVSHLPFKDNQFDIITSIDVLYHTQVEDDVKALQEYHRVLKISGRLILNLPAYEYLRSTHDKAIHTKRRYTRDDIERKLEFAGFKIEKITYRNSFFFPIILLYRLLKKNSKINSNPTSDLRSLPNSANKVLISIMKVENLILQKINFPVGSSVFCIAYKV